MTRLKRELEEVRRTRTLARRARGRVPFPTIALVGYTNAGKSTLFNRLTDSKVAAQDMLFATLDPTLRRLKLPGGPVPAGTKLYRDGKEAGEVTSAALSPEGKVFGLAFVRVPANKPGTMAGILGRPDELFAPFGAVS